MDEVIEYTDFNRHIMVFQYDEPFSNAPAYDEIGVMDTLPPFITFMHHSSAFYWYCTEEAPQDIEVINNLLDTEY